MVFAHGIGGAQDLPIPAAYAIAGAGAALTVSFLVLMFAWRRPRFDAGAGGRPVPEWLAAVIDSPVTAALLRVAGFAFFAYVAWAAVFGPDLLINPTFGVVYAWLWVGLVPASLLLGPIWKSTSPARTLNLLFARLTGGDPARGLRELPRWVGYWPAAAGLFAFVWLELVLPNSTYLGPVRMWFAAYFAVLFIGAAVFGDRWLERADPFEVYSTLVGHLALVGRRTDGQLVFRSPLANLATLQPAPGLVAVVAILLGSTAFDSFSASNDWLRFTQSTDLSMTWVNTGLLLAFCAFVAVTFSVATMATGVGDGLERRVLPGLFAHSLVPIIVGYMVAHYATLLLETGQQTLVQLSDPMGTGANLLGTADYEVSYFLSSSPTAVAVLKVAAVVTGHLLGVVAAHDRAVRLLPRRHQISGQLALLFAMICYTVGGLFLLFNG